MAGKTPPKEIPFGEIDNDSSANFAKFARQLLYDRSGGYSNNQYYSPYAPDATKEPVNSLVEYESPLPEDAHKKYGKTKFETARKEVTTLFLIDSKNRDKTAFPQPTSFTLKPPRVYKNVVSIQVTQIKLLSSFFYFRVAKGNTFLPLIERGRESINSFLGFPLTESIDIAEGSYNISDLLSNLQIQMNFTPLFYDYPSGFSGFVNAFTTNGDFSVNFNQPGDTYYDALNNKYITNPTMDQITSYYWGSRYASLTQYTISQVKVAYYYPVLYELILDPTDTAVYPYLDLDVPGNLLSEGDTVYTHIVFNSSGLNDPIILFLVNKNINLLDTYRTSHTFRFSLINQYRLSYDTNSLRVNILAVSLNTSLVNLINNTNARNLTTAIQNAGLNLVQFSNTSNTLNQAKVIFSDMYNFIQNQLTTYFAVGYATYAQEYFLNMDNILFIQNGLTASGVRTGYTTEYLTSGTVPITSTLVQYSNSPGYWPRFLSTNSINTSGYRYSGGISSDGLNPSTSMIPYSVGLSNFQFGLQTIDSSNYFIQTSRSSRSVDCLINIEPAKYTVFKFRSQTRQTLEVETLPLPYYYRFSGYNVAGSYLGVLDPDNSNVPQKYFSTPYNFLYVSTNFLMDSSNYIYNDLSVVPSRPFDTALFSSIQNPLNVQSNYTQFQFTAPWPPGIVSTGLYVYNTKLAFVSMVADSPTVSTNFTTAATGFVYHDRGGFMADLATPYRRKENPLHYVVSTSVTTSESALTINISTFSGQTYYTIMRSDGLSFGNMQFKPVVYTDTNYKQINTDYVNFSPFGDPSAASNLANLPFVENYNTDYLRLPSLSSLQGIDPSNPIYAKNTSVQNKPIGYDISGVSNDATDYRGYIENYPGFVPNSILRIDPLNTYTFQSITPFNSNDGGYFGPGTENSILEPITNTVYNYKGASTAQIKIVHWYDDYYIPTQDEDAFTTSNTIRRSPYVCSIQEFVRGYPLNASNVIQFGRGINAIGFLPTDGVYQVSSFTFKSAIYPIGEISTTVEDPNTLIKYIGIFSGQSLAGKAVQISSALTVLSFIDSEVYGPSTIVNTPGFGVELGTWYRYGYDPRFASDDTGSIVGYNQGSNELLSYDSMYYAVPFNEFGQNITYVNLTGSLVPYPLSQTVSTSSNYFGATVKSLLGTVPQQMYIMPSTIANADSNYGPQGLIPYTQSQYEQSQPIMTNSFGFRVFQPLVLNQYAMFPFRTTFSNSVGNISTGYVGLTSFVSEYSDKMYLTNSLSNAANISNAPLSFQGALYASTISTSLALRGGTVSSMHYLFNTASTSGNYPYSGLSNFNSTFLFQPMTGNNSTITTTKLELDIRGNPATIWMWGGGGGTWTGGISATEPQAGGAGAYAKIQLNVQTLYREYGVSTLYFVVGKGGNRANFTFVSTIGQIQNYEQMRYGGGGTSILESSNGSPVTNNITLQGGGFTGIFLDSNVATATPLLIVGGGGAGGGYEMGGPGGFGIVPIPFPVEEIRFSDVKLTTFLYPKAQIVSIFDWGTRFTTRTVQDQALDYRVSPYPLITNNPTLGNSYMYDGIPGTFNCVYNPFQWSQAFTLLNGKTLLFNNAGNSLKFPANIWQYNVQLSSNISSISKVRITSYTPNDFSSGIPLGFVIYSSKDRNQLLYSNVTKWDATGATQVTLLNNSFNAGNPSELQIAYDLPITDIIGNTPNVTNGWVACGINIDQFDTLQYSLDRSNWVPIRSQTGPGTPLLSTTSVVYSGIPANSPHWYACGLSTIIRSSNGVDWSSSNITVGTPTAFTGLLNSLVVASNYMLAAGSNSIVDNVSTILRTTNGTSWSYTTGAFPTNTMRLRHTTPIVWAMNSNANPSLKWSLGGQSWSNASVSGGGLTTGAQDIAFNSDIFTYVVAMGTGAVPLNTPIIYGIAASSNVLPDTWQAVSLDNLSAFDCRTVCYGNGIFVAGGITTDSNSSPVKWSYDGINWSNTDVIPQTDTLNTMAALYGVTPNSMHRAGTTLFTGTNVFWPGNYDIIINQITFNSNSGTFVSSGRGTSWRFDPGVSANSQLSIFTSQNGINWAMTFDGGYTNNRNGNGTSNITNTPYAASLGADFGPLTIVPNLSTIYLEIWKNAFAGTGTFISEIEVYNAAIPLNAQTTSNTISSIYDSNLNTLWRPNEQQVSSFGITDYSMVLNFSTIQPLVSKLRFYTPLNQQTQFTSMTLFYDPNNNPIYNNPRITAPDYNFDPKYNLSYFDAIIIPAASNISTLYLNLVKTTTSSIQVNEVIAMNDPNEPIIKYTPNLVTFVAATGGDTGSAPGFPLTNIVDGILETYWSATPRFAGSCTYDINFSFSTPAERINYMQIYVGPFAVGYSKLGISGIIVYSDSSKEDVLYSNVLTTTGKSLGENQNGYMFLGFNIIPYENVSNIYIQFINNTVTFSGGRGFPLQINEVLFFNIGRITDTPAGYTGGTIASMQRDTVAAYLFDGGGGSNGIGGLGGTYIPNGLNTPTVTARNGLDGLYLKGGSPASAGEPTGTNHFSTVRFGAGGGGGGYYGGGGGAIASYNRSGLGLFEGGAGGGGAGYFLSSPTLVTLLDYGVATRGNILTNTPSNYIPPSLSLQTALTNSNIMTAASNAGGYGVGGQQTADNGQGGHGVILVNFDQIAIVNPVGKSNATPKFVDGDKLALFEAPITYSNDNRTLPFSAYKDPIQYSAFSNYNWVWFRSFLLLTGTSLNPRTMTANSLTPRKPTADFVNMPSVVYFAIQDQFSNVISYFNANTSLSNTIIAGIQIAFELHNNFLTNTVYTDSKYIEFTELYCLLDYLRQPANLSNHHVDSITSPLSRVFGGLPRFGYWANPFLTNVSYIGFDTGPSLAPPQTLSSITQSTDIVQAFYGLVLEQSLSSGKYVVKDLMAYKPTQADASNYGSNWLKATQFTESYLVRPFDAVYLNSNLSVQPYTMGSAIEGILPVFNYKVYTSPMTRSDGVVVDAPIQIINDFQGQITYLYTYQNFNAADYSTIHMSRLLMTSTTIQVNQTNITSLSNAASNIIGTLSYENFNNLNPSTSVSAVTQFGFNFASNYPLNPIINFTTGTSNYYNKYSINSQIASSNVGRTLSDVFGNLYVSDRLGGSKLYQNVCTIQVFQQQFSNSPLKFASPSYYLSQYIPNEQNIETKASILNTEYANLLELQTLLSVAQANVDAATVVLIQSSNINVNAISALSAEDNNIRLAISNTIQPYYLPEEALTLSDDFSFFLTYDTGIGGLGIISDSNSPYYPSYYYYYGEFLTALSGVITFININNYADPPIADPTGYALSLYNNYVTACNAYINDKTILEGYMEDVYNINVNILEQTYVVNAARSSYISAVTAAQGLYYDFFVSRYTNIWHLQGTSNLSTIYGVRLTSPYDFSITTNFANQIFYPTHKITLRQTALGINPITNTTDLATYPSYSKTQMFFYRNFSTLKRDIDGQFGLEKSSNFAYSDTKFSGYFFNSFIQNINMPESTNFNNANADSFNYLAIRAYSPSETFKTLVRFYLPGRYDFGYISIKDLSNEVVTLQGNSNVNAEYLTVLGIFTSTFATTRTYGGTGLPGYSGSNITTTGFGSFLQKYKGISDIINSNAPTITSILSKVLEGQSNLITGDLQNILPAYVAARERVTDPLEFKLPFSTIAQASNRTIEEYSIGYNLGFAQADTPFNTIQRAGSFFKILDDYIYMKMNDEYNMNRLDISRQEDFSVSHDTQAESRLYNCKLMLNNFGTYATTLVQNPVLFNPPIGKLDKLSFSWYDVTGAIINNTECEWSGAIQVVESVDLATNDSTIPKM